MLNSEQHASNRIVHRQQSTFDRWRWSIDRNRKGPDSSSQHPTIVKTHQRCVKVKGRLDPRRLGHGAANDVSDRPTGHREEASGELPGGRNEHAITGELVTEPRPDTTAGHRSWLPFGAKTDHIGAEVVTMSAGDFEIESPLARKGRHRMAGQLGGRIAGLGYPEAPFVANLDDPSLPHHADKRAIGVVHILDDEPCANKAVVASQLGPFEAEGTVHGTDALFAAIPH